jgi:hypothetical protein
MSEERKWQKRKSPQKKYNGKLQRQNENNVQKQFDYKLSTYIQLQSPNAVSFGKSKVPPECHSRYHARSRGDSSSRQGLGLAG